MCRIVNSVISSDMQEIYDRCQGWCDYKNATVLITGAYGMLASYIAEYLIWLNEEHQQNITIIFAIRSLVKARERFGEFLDRDYIKLYTLNINTPFEWEGRIDYIIHAAGIANPELYAVFPTEVAETSVLSTYYLLKWASRNPIKGFLYFSSGDVYGKVDDPSNITEETLGLLDPLDLHSCYGGGKRMAETWCMTFAHEYNVPAMSARIGHTYSPYIDVDNDPRVFSVFVKNAIAGKDIELTSDGTAKRPFCYITDAIVGYFLILIYGIPGNAYNVSNSNEFISVGTLAEIISQIVQPNVKVIKNCVRNDRYLQDKCNHQNFLCEDKLMSLGWHPIITTQEGFRRVIRYQICKKELIRRHDCDE